MKLEQELEQWQREYLSQFCLENCTKLCCGREKVKVLMNESQVREVYDLPPTMSVKSSEHYLNDYILAGEQKGGASLFWVSIHPTREQPFCPAYDPKSRLCRIEHNKPDMCKSYPVHVEGDIILLSSTCCATQTDNFASKKLRKISETYSARIHVLKNK